MKPRTTIIVVSTVTFLAGALSAGGAAIYATTSLLHRQFADIAYANAARAQVEAQHLAKLRSGDISTVIDQLETMLDGHTIQLGAYEEQVEPSRRDPFVYRALADVRQYRQSYPAKFVPGPTGDV